MIRWTDGALADLANIGIYLREKHGFDASSLLQKLLERTEQLEMFPLSGRKVPEYDKKQIRELIHSSWRILYYLVPDGIEILAVMHQRQDIQSQLDET